MSAQSDEGQASAALPSLPQIDLLIEDGDPGQWDAELVVIGSAGGLDVYALALTADNEAALPSAWHAQAPGRLLFAIFAPQWLPHNFTSRVCFVDGRLLQGVRLGAAELTAPTHYLLLNTQTHRWQLAEAQRAARHMSGRQHLSQVPWMTADAVLTVVQHLLAHGKMVGQAAPALRAERPRSSPRSPQPCKAWARASRPRRMSSSSARRRAQPPPRFGRRRRRVGGARMSPEPVARL